MKKAIFLLAIALYGTDAVSQSDKDISVNAYLGAGKLEIKDSEILSVNTVELAAGIEIFKKKDYAIQIGLEYTLATGSFATAGSNLFLENKYISLPLSYKVFQSEEGSLVSFVGEAGIYGSYLMNSSRDIKSLDISDSDSSAGIGFGVSAQLGADFKANENFKFHVGFRGKTDIANSAFDDQPVYHLKNIYSIVVGFAYKL